MERVDVGHEYKDTLIVNRLNGGRLTVKDGALVDGGHIIVVRYSKWDKSHPQRWTVKKVGEENGWDIVAIEQSDDKGNTFRVDVGSNDPEAGEGSFVRIKKADDSDRQKWWFGKDRGGTGMEKLIPYVDSNLSMTVRRFGEDWEYVVLEKFFSSVDRLWYFNDRDYKEEIPN